MATISTKIPTINNLIQQQKQLSLKLLNSQSLPNSSLSLKINYDRFKQSLLKQKISQSSEKGGKTNLWQQINQRVFQARKQANQLSLFPSQFKRADSQYKTAKMRIQLEKNKLKKLQLFKEKKNIQKYTNVQRLKLDRMLNELQRLENQIKIKGIIVTQQRKSSQIKQNITDKQFPSIETLLAQIGLQNKQKYLQPIKFSHYECKPIQFFQNLASYTMETEREIQFTNKKRIQEEQKVEQSQQNYKKMRNSNQDIGQKLHKAKKEQQSYKQQLFKLQSDISFIKKDSYVQEQLSQRIKILKQNYEQERKKKHLAILKLCKLVQLSGNQEAIQLVQNILKSNGIQK